MGSVPNVGLMAQKAEEYGSHDKTFEVPADGTMRVVDAAGTVLIEHAVEAGRHLARVPGEGRADPRLGEARRQPRPRHRRARGLLARRRPRPRRAADREGRDEYLAEHDTDGLEFHILPPVEATRFSLERMKGGQDTISVTGNVLRDYLTDLFPILEVGTSAKMLSIVPLMNGGGLFETGAGGSAPKHVQQFVKEGHLRWDSLGEEATSQYLLNRKAPSRKCGEQDNRTSHFYVALYWARALAAQTDDADLAARFATTASYLADEEDVIVERFIEVQGAPVDIGGYYRPDAVLAGEAMRPSENFNEILEGAMAETV